jgi:hypothetical protein
MLFLIGCGGGGGGGSAQPLTTDEPDESDQPENKIPAASITSPTGTQFNEGENIAFGGNATDEEDGALEGDSLVWTSNIDGIIGNGPAVTTSALTAGDHEITLTATDSQGGSHTTDPTLIHIAQTRFIKMGTQTTGVTDAANAFDGDLETAATIVTPDIEFIHFKAYIGGAETFIFKIKFGGASPAGSKLAVQGLTGDSTWRPIGDIGVNGTENTMTFKVTNPQAFKDSLGYINLRVRWEGGGSDENVSIYELWRIDPIYAGPQPTGAISVDLAFDGNQNTKSAITKTWDNSGSAPFLHFKSFVGKGTADTFSFNLLHNNIGIEQSVYIDIENLATPDPNDWINIADFKLNTTDARKVTVANVQDYLDEEGYISLRARWVGYVSGNQMEIYEISRSDPFFLGAKTTLGEDWEYNEELAVDGIAHTNAFLYYSWGELDRHEFLHAVVYKGDASVHRFSIEAALSAESIGAVMVVEGEQAPDNWSEIERFDINGTIIKKNIELINARQFVNSNGYLSVRLRWESDSDQYDAYIYEISNY